MVGVEPLRGLMLLHTIVCLLDGLTDVRCVLADVPFDEGWRIEVKQRTGGSSAGTSDAVS